jgi:hypothetical protein
MPAVASVHPSDVSGGPVGSAGSAWWLYHLTMSATRARPVPCQGLPQRGEMPS